MTPSIAQLVERWTVVVLHQKSIGRWFKSGSKDFYGGAQCFKGNRLFPFNLPYSHPFLDSLVVRISACHVEGPGSIPGRGECFSQPCEMSTPRGRICSCRHPLRPPVVGKASPDKSAALDALVRMAERSKALRSGRSPLLWAWVRIPLLTKYFLFDLGLVFPARVGGYQWAVSVVVITSALHAEGRQFEPGTAQML